VTSWVSSVGIVTRPLAACSKNRSSIPGGDEKFITSPKSRTFLVPIQARTQPVTGGPSSGDKVARVTHSHPVKRLTISGTISLLFYICFDGVDRNNFTFYLYLKYMRMLYLNKILLNFFKTFLLTKY
jgi:hypothetical protein